MKTNNATQSHCMTVLNNFSTRRSSSGGLYFMSTFKIFQKSYFMPLMAGMITVGSMHAMTTPDMTMPETSEPKQAQPSKKDLIFAGTIGAFAKDGFKKVSQVMRTPTARGLALALATSIIGIRRMGIATSYITILSGRITRCTGTMVENVGIYAKNYLTKEKPKTKIGLFSLFNRSQLKIPADEQLKLKEILENEERMSAIYSLQHLM
jgi:hypothetical protein